MKNTILKTIILFLLAIPFKSEAQKYRKMLGDSSVWYEIRRFEAIWTEFEIAYNDSLIDGIHYKIIEHRPNFNNDIRAFIREDTLTQKIFLKRVDSINLPENLLYDFSKQVGDTIVNIAEILANHYRYPMVLNTDTGYIIDSIVLTPMLGDSLRFFYGHKLSYYKKPFIWIERVGNPMGLFDNFADYYNWEFISCKFSDGVHQYKANPDHPFLKQLLDTSCSIFLSDIPLIENLFSNMYPNPFSNKLTLEGKPLQNYRAEVYDIRGALLEAIIINENEINFNNYYNGLVLIRIIDREGKTVGVVKGIKLAN